MIIYLTYNDQPSGVYWSQVTDVVEHLNTLNVDRVKLVALVSARGFFATRRKIKQHSPSALVIPMVPTMARWRKNTMILAWVCRLLKPKAGGIAFVLDAMGGALHSILDVTIVYPNGRPSMADLLADRIGEVRVKVQQYPIPAELVSGDYQNDAAFRERVQDWINSLWASKDRAIADLLGPAR